MNKEFKLVIMTSMGGISPETKGPMRLKSQLFLMPDEIFMYH